MNGNEAMKEMIARILDDPVQGLPSAMSQIKTALFEVIDSKAQPNKIRWTGPHISALIALVNDLHVKGWIDTRGYPAAFIVEHFADENGNDLPTGNIDRQYRRLENEGKLPKEWPDIRFMVKHAEIMEKQ